MSLLHAPIPECHCGMPAAYRCVHCGRPVCWRAGCGAYVRLPAADWNFPGQKACAACAWRYPKQQTRQQTKASE